ncbi:ExbD/TolR family protein [Methanobacterium paludis]|uniref:Biopolymer transport protein ExbD/TolR n=1 Tax=Methanobacterium paludis (strain DSM 25820 / JCM 18151 / SWAN1) TaxID=868131 RepID=F6D1M7_METPW|nr:biopolymer transporter ExbD [Methanobacterium paludis]AEG17255.1 Biopolymer transport protein ExbD/TolR [Methanobacterium paludis]
MPLDTKRYKNRLRRNKAQVNLVPLIDVIFTILIFLMVTSSFQAATQTSTTSGKPEVSQTSGTSEYYLIPVAGLKNVTVNGVDMSQDIKNGAIAVHTDVIDEGEIVIKSKEGAIIITTPTGMSPEEAVTTPSS